MILYDARWSGPHGIGRFSVEVEKRLVGLQYVPDSIPLLHPMEPMLLTELTIKARKKFKTYFSPGFNPPLWAPMPVIFTIHDLIHLRFKDESSAAKKLYYQTIVRPNVRRAAKVLTVSEFSKQEIIEWAGVDDEQVLVVKNGIGPEFAPDGPRYEPGYPYLLYIGNRKPHKNIPRLLEGFVLSGLADEVRLMVSGKADNEMVDLCRLLGLEKRIVFAGIIPDSDLPRYYRGALGLLLPSLYEGFGLPAVEALASGIPVVVANTTSLPEIVGESAIMVDPLDTGSIAKGIAMLCEEDGAARMLRVEKGLHHARQFDWDKTAGMVWDELSRFL